MKILLNAEAFGFGPSAAISAIFDILQQHFSSDTYKENNTLQLDYIGQGHTLDLQSKLSYQKIYHYTNEDHFKDIVKGYDFFISALDFEKAKFAKEVGVKTIVYDTLLWYWKDKSIVEHADFYITQDFYGVNHLVDVLNENILKKGQQLKTYIIPPLIQRKDITTKCEDFLLINFGGLENPYWTVDVTANYIRKILTVILPIVQQKFKKIKIVCSQNHLHHLQDFPVTTASYQEMQNLLQKASYIIATSGLGNIYELANYQVPSLFLPPVNDSQGQQLNILKQDCLIDNALDWSDFQYSIDYFKEQNFVLNDIKDCIDDFNYKLFTDLFNSKINHKGNLNLHHLFTCFGFNGKNALESVFQDIFKH